MAGTRARTAVEAAPAVDRHRPDLGRRAGLRDPADAAVLDHPVAPLRLHDHQPGAARLRRERRLADAGAGAPCSERFAPLFCAAAAAFGVSAIGCFALAQRVPFNPLEILWDPRQPAYLLAVYLLLALPFLCAGACVCMAFSRWRGMASRIYSFDILGAGAGSLAVVGLLFVLPPQRRIEADRRAGIRRRGGGVARMRRPAALAGGSADGHGRPALPVAASRGSRPRCRRTRSCRRPCAFPQARVVEERFSPLGLVSVVESPRIAVAPCARA